MFRRFIKTEKHARLRGGDLRATTLLFICARACACICARAYFSRKSESSGETNEEVDALKKRVVIIIRGRGGKKGKGNFGSIRAPRSEEEARGRADALTSDATERLFT